MACNLNEKLLKQDPRVNFTDHLSHIFFTQWALRADNGSRIFWISRPTRLFQPKSICPNGGRRRFPTRSVDAHRRPSAGSAADRNTSPYTCELCELGGNERCPTSTHRRRRSNTFGVWTTPSSRSWRRLGCWVMPIKPHFSWCSWFACRSIGFAVCLSGRFWWYIQSWGRPSIWHTVQRYTRTLICAGTHRIWRYRWLNLELTGWRPVSRFH